MNPTTDDLRSALADQVTRIPYNPRREQQIANRLRRRRRRQVAGSAATVTAVVVAAVLAVQNLPLGSGAETQGRPDGTPRPVPVERLAPQAVHTLPRKLPNGHSFMPALFADRNTLIVLGQSGGASSSQSIWRYDVRTKQATRLARVESSSSFPTAVVDNRVYWHSMPFGTDRLDIWSVSLAGGSPKRVTVKLTGGVNREGSFQLVIADGMAVTAADDAGIQQAPLSGGQSKRIPGTEGMHVVSWPWVGAAPATPGEKQPSLDLLNVRTGEWRRAGLSGEEGWLCSLSWCVNRAGQLGATERRVRPGRPILRRRDGSGTRVLPYRPVGTVDGERFLPVTLDGSADHGDAVYDIKTKKVIDLRQATRYKYMGRSDGLFFATAGDSVHIVDLGAIP
jgi:hypothetical protein